MKIRPINNFVLVILTSALVMAGGCRKAAQAPTTIVQPTPNAATIPELPASQAEEPSLEGLATPTALMAPETTELHPTLDGLAGLPFDQFLQESFKVILLRDPERVTSEGLATALGTDNARLTDISDSYLQESLEIYRSLLDLLHGYDRANLSAEEQISYDTYTWYLDDLLRQGEYRVYEYLINPTITGVQYQLEYLFTDLHPFQTLQDAQDYVSRLNQVEGKIVQLIEVLAISQSKGIYPPQVAIQASLGGIQGIAASHAEATPYYRTLQEKLGLIEGLSAVDRTALLEDARRAIENSVIPGYQQLASYLAEMQTIENRDGGVWQQPEGDAYYRAALRHHTTTDLGPDEIHQLGLDELQRIQAEMRQRFDDLGYPQEESLVQLFQRAAADGGYVRGGEILDGYRALIEEASQNLDQAFGLQPSAGLEVKAGPGSTAFYVSPAVDGTRPGVFYAPLGGSEPRFKLPTLAYHEGVPGHHYQISLAQEMDLPLFRSIAGFTGYIEGWALYAERLAQELGWYDDDPYGDLGRLQMEAFRAARLVVDTGLHARQWTFDQAVDFLVENTGLERGFIQNEVVRYLVWPGQAASYAVGYLELLELRQEAMDALGEGFDLKDFHQLVLGSGSLPLEVLDGLVNEYTTLASLKQINDYPLYTLHYQGDYGFAEFLESGLRPEAMQLNIPFSSTASLPDEPAWACTGFAALGLAGQRLMGRNFDWMLHPALLLFTDPPDGYASVSMVDLYYLGFEKQVTADQRNQLLRAPYLPFDGMNESGLAVGMMAVPEADSGYDPARVTISDLNLIRLVLDNAASIEEAAALMGQYNVDFGGGPPIHYFLADSTGSSAVVEFVSGEMRVLSNQFDWQVSTNFLVSQEQPKGANSSCWRYNQAYAALEESAGVLGSQAAMDLLESVSQEGQYGTRWSVVYGLDSGEVILAIGGEYGEVYRFNLAR